MASESLSSKNTEASNLAAIENLAGLSAAQLRSECTLLKQHLEPAWAEFTGKLSKTGNSWNGDYADFMGFWKSLRAAASIISDENANQVASKIGESWAVHEDWTHIRGFLQHDIAHLKPNDLFRIFHDLSGRWSRHGVELQGEDKEFLDLVVSRSAELSALQALPIEFVQSVAQFEQGKEIPSEELDIQKLMEQIAIRIKTRFAFDDYVISNQSQPGRNTIVVPERSDRMLQANKSMIFSICYNLAKNAAKANSERMDLLTNTHPIRPLQSRYGYAEKYEGPTSNIQLGIEETQKSVILNIADTGPGLSLDDSLRGVHAELAKMIDTASPDEIKSSQVYKTITGLLGREQAEYLYAWPTNSHALRGLTVGSIFDLRFLAGFSGKAWDIKSLTSGMGLWGARYITERLGGTVMGTNKFEGGALFSLILPKEKVSNHA